MKQGILAFVLVFILIISLSSAENAIEIVDYKGNYTQLDTLEGEMVIHHEVYIPPEAALYAFINNKLSASLLMADYVGDISGYTFTPQPFSYDMTAFGENIWKEYEVQDFEYEIKAEGTCGNTSGPAMCYNETTQQDWCDCDCGPPYPCPWSATFMSSGSVSGDQGLEFVYDGLGSITEPGDTNNDTLWSVWDDNAQVETTMRAACGDEQYSSYSVWDDGWVRREINEGELEGVPGTADKFANIEKFDHDSLLPGQTQYDGGPGGIRKDNEYQYFGPDVEWTGNTGYILIKNYDTEAEYTITYLPPNGARLCAFTGYSKINKIPWEVSETISGLTVDYVTQKEIIYTKNQLLTLLPPPDCPGFVPPENCEKNVYSYEAIKSYDPYNSVDISFNSVTYTVTATTTSMDLTQEYILEIGFVNFSTPMKAPSIIGKHIIDMNIKYSGNDIVTGATTFSTCGDNDGDGFCEETGDCDDNDPEVNPLISEECNGKDDDCDGDIDEDFWKVGSKLGNQCGIGACYGIWVCTPDGSNVVCNNKYFPGEMEEICGDSVDNDCDGYEDEEFEYLADGSKLIGCVCKNGGTKPCGSNIGECREGYQICVKNEWTTCMNEITPIVEVCNQRDDDCDGIVDNLGGKKSVIQTACQCYDKNPPTNEACNDIDDDCDGDIDESIICCSPGETRSCGSDVGTCMFGIQNCFDGYWGPCQGGVTSVKEVCYNEVDDDCDGIADEACSTYETCRNRVKDINEQGVDCGGACPEECEDDIYWILITIIVVVIAAFVLYGVLAGKTS
jgi:hypothetical protein